MFCAGLDISTRNLDFVILNTEHPSECEHRRVELATEDGRWWESARGMEIKVAHLAWFDGFLADVDLLGIERPYGPSRQSIASLHVILGAVLATIPQHITVLEVRPAEMRRHLGLPGNCSKERMHDAVWTKTNGYPLSELTTKHPCPDMLDAWAVAWAAYRMCEKAAAGCRHDEHRKGGEPNQ